MAFAMVPDKCPMACALVRELKPSLLQLNVFSVILVVAFLPNASMFVSTSSFLNVLC